MRSWEWLSFPRRQQGAGDDNNDQIFLFSYSDDQIIINIVGLSRFHSIIWEKQHYVRETETITFPNN